MIISKRPPKMTVFLAIVIFFSGLIIAGVLPPIIAEMAIQLQILLTCFILLLFLICPGYRLAIIKPNQNETYPLQNLTAVSTEPLPLAKYWLRLFTLQGILVYISFFFFYSLELHTRSNPRLQALPEGQIFEMMQTNFFQLSYIPWVLYSVVGVGLAYFSVCYGRYPTLPQLIFPKPRGSFQWISHNYLNIVVDAVMLGPFIWLLPLSMIWVSDGLNALFDQNSLMDNPLRSMFILGLLFVFSNRLHRTLLDAMDRFKIPMGIMLVLYILLASLFIFLLNAISGWVMIAFESPSSIIKKSLLSHALTGEMQERRLAILIWSWWGIWLPWMASQVARLSVGRKLWAACLSSLILPTLLLILVYGYWGGELGGEWKSLFRILEQSWILKEGWTKFLFVSPVILFLFYFFRQIHSAEDFAKAGLLAYGHRRKQHSLRRWMNGLMILMFGHMIGLFMMGWLSVQILSTLGALVMMTVLLGFIFALLSSSEVISMIKKRKLLENI